MRLWVLEFGRVTKRERDGEVEAGGGKRENEKKNGFLF